MKEAILQCSRCKRLRGVILYGDGRDDRYKCCDKAEMLDVTESYLEKLRKQRELIKQRKLEKEKKNETNRFK